jgi:hypothetical protein
MNQTLIAAVEYTNQIKKNVVVCTYFPLLFLLVLPVGPTFPFHEPVLENTHQICLSLFFPLISFMWPILKTSFSPSMLVFIPVINLLGMHSTFCQANPACLSKLFRVALPTSSRPSYPISLALPFFATSKASYFLPSIVLHVLRQGAPSLGVTSKQALPTLVYVLLTGVEVLIMVTMKNDILWDMTPHSLVEIYRCFGGTYCPNL